MNRWPFCTLLTGIFLLLTTIIVWIQFPNIINSKIEEQLQLRNGSETFEKWRNITIPIFIKLTFFNVTNPDQILRGATPILNEVGPFVYQETRLKTIDGIDLEKDTVTYRQAITYYFRPELSVGSEDVQLTVLNIPLVSVAKQASSGNMRGGFVATTVDEFFRNNPEERSIFLTRTVGQMLFEGYEVPLIKHLASFNKDEEILPNNTFGLFYDKNGTFGNQYTVLSGARSSKDFGVIVRWNGLSKLSWWNNNEYCNQINGSDGSLFPPFLTRESVLRLFAEDFCRSSHMTYQKDIEYLDIPGYRFTMPASLWESGETNPENECFCRNGAEDPPVKHCSRTGTFSLSTCRKGAPVVASYPYFLHGTENDQQMYNLVPNAEDHETFIDIEPRTGMVLRGRKNFQVNVEMSKTNKVVGFKKLPNVLFPIIFGEEFATTTEERAADLRFKLIVSVKIVNIIKWSFLIASTALIMHSILVIYKKSKSKS